MIEHARPLDPDGLLDLGQSDLDDLARRIEKLRARAPFQPPRPLAATPREQALRQYLAAFGIESPPSIAGERERAEGGLAEVLGRLAEEKPHATTAHVWAPPPIRPETTAKAIASLRARHVDLRWSLPPFDAGIGHERDRRSPVADAVDEAVRRRARAMRRRGERQLRRLGVRVVKSARERDPRREGTTARGRTAETEEAP